MPLNGLKIGCLGGGAMAEAMLTGLVKSGLQPGKLYVSDVNEKRLEFLKQKLGLNVVHSNKAVAENADIVLIAVKPQVVKLLMSDVGPLLRCNQTLICIAAGITTQFLEGFIREQVPVVRVMPNTPCLVGAGASAVCIGTYAGMVDKERAFAIFSSFGRAVEVPESLMDAVTGLSGSGPAYIFVLIEALADAGVRMGLPRDVALTLGAQTVMGSAQMLLETGEHPGRLKDMVTTPGGTTIAGLYALEEGGLRALIMRAVEAATKRSRELSGA